MSKDPIYNLVVVTMFKNESWIIKDWIQHYIKEGVDHFFLIDNGSTDNYEDQITGFKDKITLVKDSTRYPSATQTRLINHHFKDIIIKTSRWVLICDLDEYIYSRNQYKQITDVLKQAPEHVKIIFMPWKIFGSNKHVHQPNGIIESFTKRSQSKNWKYNDCPNLDHYIGLGKSMIRVTEQLILDVHTSFPNDNKVKYLNQKQLVENKQIYNSCFESITEEKTDHDQVNLHLNHYMFMSRDYYEKIKCTRGGGYSGMTSKYTIDYFDRYEGDYNKIVDEELKNK
jgi:hypothetical protein